jgi:phosphopantothenoylcysteine decarboxylase/phosphopantothenate--cysteine ligase
VLNGKRILLGVCGGIAAYKACELARQLIREGAEVQVVLTPAAAEFVTPLTFTALTGKQAWVSEFGSAEAPPVNLRASEASQIDARGRDDLPKVNNTLGQSLTDEGVGSTSPYVHLDLTRGIDCFVIAPATAGTLGKLASGVADNLLTSAYLSCTAPVVIAPAMNVRMWQHDAVRANVETLRGRGHAVVEPGSGELACGDIGAGRLAEIQDIADAVQAELASALSLENAASGPLTMAAGVMLSSSTNGKKQARVIVTAGGTREYLDPVRFITNNSTGALGVEVCRALHKHGVGLELIDTSIVVPAEVESSLTKRIEVATAFDLQGALQRALPNADGLVMLAAVADYGPTRYSPTKRKKDGVAWSLELAETPDLLASLAPLRQPGQVFVGVSLEDTDWLKRAQKKCAAKGCDAMLAVELTGELPYGERRMHCALVTAEEILSEPAMRTKPEAATMLADWLAPRLGGTRIEQAELRATQSV